MEEIIIECLYDPTHLEPIFLELQKGNESSQALLMELVKARVYLEWQTGLNVAIFVLLVILIISVYLSNMK